MTRIASVILISIATLSAVGEANAVVCARGVYRAGCAGAGGGVVVRRPVVAPVCTFVRGVRVCR